MFDKFQQALKKFVEERDWDQFHSLKNLAINLTVESSELLEHFTWSDAPQDMRGVKDELGDVMFSLVLIANKLGVSLEECGLEKLEKTALNYPVEKSKGKAIKYSQL